MTETLATFLLLLILAVGFLGEIKAWKWVLLGILSALAYLARTQFVILIPLAFVFAWIRTAKPQRTRVTFLVLTGLALPVLPRFARNLRVAGDPTFSFTTTRNSVLDAIPGQSDLEMQLHAPVDLIMIIGQYGRQIGAKVLKNASTNALSPRYWANGFRRMNVIFPLPAIVSLLDLWESEWKKVDVGLVAGSARHQPHIYPLSRRTPKRRPIQAKQSSEQAI